MSDLVQHIIDHEILGISASGGGSVASEPPRNIWITATGLPSGGSSLSDAVNWASRYSYISSINVQTTSLNWSLWICETSAFDLSSLRSRRLVLNGAGGLLVPVGLEVNSDSNSLHLFFTSPGAETFAVYVTGEGRRH